MSLYCLKHVFSVCIIISLFCNGLILLNQNQSRFAARAAEFKMSFLVYSLSSLRSRFVLVVFLWLYSTPQLVLPASCSSPFCSCGFESFFPFVLTGLSCHFVHFRETNESLWKCVQAHEWAHHCGRQHNRSRQTLKLTNTAINFGCKTKKNTKNCTKNAYNEQFNGRKERRWDIVKGWTAINLRSGDVPEGAALMWALTTVSDYTKWQWLIIHQLSVTPNGLGILHTGSGD